MNRPQARETTAPAAAPKSGAGVDMRFVPGGVFTMGSDRHYADEAPARRVRVDPFWMDRAPVTNGAFKRFVDATGYVTFAEKAPSAADFGRAAAHAARRLGGVHQAAQARDHARPVAVVVFRVRRELAPSHRGHEFDRSSDGPSGGPRRP